MTNSRANDNVFDALFKQAVIDNFEEQLDSLSQDAEPSMQYTFSTEHEKRMSMLFAKEKRKEVLRTTVKWGRRVAAIFLIAVTVLFGSLMLVPEARAVIVGTIIEWFDQYTRFTSTIPTTDESSLEPTYIPDGFFEVFRDDEIAIKSIVWRNSEDEFIDFMSV